MKRIHKTSTDYVKTMTRHGLRTAMALAIGAGIGLASVHTAAAQTQTSQGSWSTLPYTMPINPLHAALMHSGRVVIVAGSENDTVDSAERVSLAAVWDPQTGTITVQNLQWDVFCNGGACFPDGRFLIVGGTDQYDPFYGSTQNSIFDPVTEKFNDVEYMAHGRWYATVTELNDGRLMTFSGLNELGSINKAVEIYTVGSGWSPEYVAPWSPPLYPWMHLLPNGKIFYSGYTASSSIFDPSTQTWTMNVANTVYNNTRLYGSSVLLPLMPSNSYAPRVLIMGGHDPDATATAEIIDLSVANPAWRAIAPMSKPRIEMNAVILPNGKVLAVGGSATNEDATTASLRADLFNPTTETWSPAGVEAYPRLYHSVALLLPDATVWVAGSNPNRGTYEPHMEIYSPPYLYTTNASGGVIAASRPSITAVQSEIGYGGTFSIQTADASTIKSVVLIRPGAPTHAFDEEQRLVGLTFSLSGQNTLTATAPPNGSVAPPGYYMLFILNNAGVPSTATFVHLTSTPTNLPPNGTITSPTGDVTIQEGQSISFDGSATDPDGTISKYSWIFPEGTPDESSQQHPGSVTFNDAGVYVVSMTAIDDAGVNDPNPPTRTIRVQPPGLVAAYSFDEGSGTAVADSSGNNNDGVINGASWTTSGRYGNALSFNGTSALVTIPNSASLQLQSGMTLEAWVFATTTTLAWQDVIYKGNDNYYLMASSSRKGWPPVGGGQFGSPAAYAEADGTNSLATYTWTHLAITYDGATLRLYVNGVQVASKARTGNILTSTNPLQIGGDTLYSQYFAGLIDEVRVYNHALNVSEIQADMTMPVGGSGSSAPPDTQPPTAPGGLNATAVSSSQINLSWTASTDNVGVTGYLVERQGGGSASFAQIGTASATTYNDTGLLAGTNYSYRVRATDAAGNLSAYSNVDSATTSNATGSAGLVAAYAFSEGSGTTVADSSGNNNAGTLSGTTWTTSGKYGNALSFNGTSARVTISDSASLRLTRAMTLEAWVYPTTVSPAWRDVIYKGNDNYYLEGSSSPGGAPATGGSAIGAPVRGPSALTASTWTHLATTYDGATLRLYVNGVQVASRAQTGSLATSSNPLQIGGDSLYGQFFAGRIDEVRVYNRALSATELQSDMNTPIGGSSPPDTQPPTAPGGLNATAVSSSQINLSWTASTDNVGVTGYLVERQGGGSASFAQIGTTSATTYNDTGLLAGTNYSYRVRAKDAAGNLSAYSNVASATTSNATTSSGLVAAYSFSEGSGTTVADSSSNNNTGTLSGTTWITTGKYGRALSFNGTSALVTISDSASLRLTSAMTLEAWVNPTTVSGAWRDVIYKGNDNYYLEGTSSPNAVPATGGSAIGATLRGSAALTANTWTHLATTYDGATLRMYVNGVQVASRAQTGSLATSSNPLQIGGDSLYGQFFAGSIDEVRVYNRALSAPEIQADMNAPLP